MLSKHPESPPEGPSQTHSHAAVRAPLDREATASGTSFSDDDGPQVVDVEAICAGQAVAGNFTPVFAWHR